MSCLFLLFLFNNTIGGQMEDWWRSKKQAIPQRTRLTDSTTKVPEIPSRLMLMFCRRRDFGEADVLKHVHVRKGPNHSSLLEGHRIGFRGKTRHHHLEWDVTRQPIFGKIVHDLFRYVPKVLFPLSK